MYQSFYEFKSNPFPIPPNVNCVYYSGSFLELIYYFKYGFKSDESIFLVTGDYGAGKSTFCNKLIKMFKGMKDIDYIFISTPNHDYFQILRKISRVMGIEVPSQHDLQDVVFGHFSQPEHLRKFYVVIDDVNELDVPTLSKLRFLADFSQNGFYPFRLILFAHTSFLETLKLPELIPLAKRIRRRVKLEPLTLEETAKYIQFRLSKVREGEGPRFTAGGVRKIHEMSGGTPRTIHMVCDASLILGAMAGLRTIGGAVVSKAIQNSGLLEDLQGDKSRTWPGVEEEDVGSFLEEKGREGESANARIDVKQTLSRFAAKDFLMMSDDERRDQERKGRGLRTFIVIVCLFIVMVIVSSFFDLRSFLGGLF